jgi:hypothetical protein
MSLKKVFTEPVTLSDLWQSIVEKKKTGETKGIFWKG